MRNLIRQNALANLLGHGWATALQLVLTPFYIRFLGIEAYALIGFYLMLVATVQIFDFGLSQTLNRELSRLSVNAQEFRRSRDLLRTLECIYWPVVVVVCSFLLILTPALARGFLNAQVLANGLRIFLSTLTGVGAILVILFVSRSIIAFFWWQAICAAVALVVFSFALYRSLPDQTHKARFRSELLAKVWRFATGITAISLSALILTQFDKWILAKILPLAAFGYFMLAVTVAGGLNLMVTPLFNAVFPRFSGLVAEGKEDTLLGLYHLATAAMAVFLLPVTLCLCLFANEVLFIWTANPEVAHQSGPLLAVLVLGTALNGLFHIPYALALAKGQTGFVALMNFVAIAILVPAVWYFAGLYGAIVAAVSWFALNLAYLFVFVPIVHRQFHARDRVQWIVRDIGEPLALSLLVLGLARWLLPEGLGRLATTGYIGAALLAAVLVTVGLSPRVRRLAWETIFRNSAALPESGR
jgi:O-antigen/teichoic acid export membrane protein